VPSNFDVSVTVPFETVAVTGDAVLLFIVVARLEAITAAVYA
jgi:hypothetical protein